MIDVQSWMGQAVTVLRDAFGPRLLFVGLQGSYRRGEAGEDSDIDILTLLDRVDISDLARYRRELRMLPEGEKACGFTCGRQELLAWPPFELFQFARDTDAYFGQLDPYLPPFTRADTVAGARIAVSGLHHYVTYLYVSGEEGTRTEPLRESYKSFFFVMQVVEYLRSGVYARSKKELLSRLTGIEAELLHLGMDAAAYRERQAQVPDMLFRVMLDWTGGMMSDLANL